MINCNQFTYYPLSNKTTMKIIIKQLLQFASVEKIVVLLYRRSSSCSMCSHHNRLIGDNDPKP